MKVSVVNKNGIFNFYDVSHIVIVDDDNKVIFKTGFDAGNVPPDKPAHIKDKIVNED